VRKTRENFPGTPWEGTLLHKEKLKESNSQVKNPPIAILTSTKPITQLSETEASNLTQELNKVPPFTLTLTSEADNPKKEQTALERSCSPLAIPPLINMEKPDNQRNGIQELTQAELWGTLTQPQLFELLAKLTPTQVRHLIKGTDGNPTEQTESCSMKEDKLTQNTHSSQGPDSSEESTMKTLTNQSIKTEMTEETADSTQTLKTQNLNCPPISKHQNQLQELKQDTLTREGDLIKQAGLIEKEIKEIQSQTIQLDKLILETQPEGAELQDSVASMMSQDEIDLKEHQMGELGNKELHQNDGTSK
jgi:hypothetical protein